MHCWRPLTLVFLLLSSAVVLASNPPVNADDIVGDWMAQTGDGVVRIYKQGNEYRGRLVWAGRESKTWWAGEPAVEIPWEDKAATKKLKHTPLLGSDILVGLEFDGQSHWKGGRIFNVLNGKTYACKISIPTTDVLKLKGYV